jgi:hypothetical protein
MAWRIDEQVIRGEIDSRVQGRVTGRIWLVELNEPVELDLGGNPWRDLAGRVLRFSNPSPKAGELDRLAGIQDGKVGDMTASRKAKVPDCSMEEVKRAYAAKLPISYHWANTLYLEWFSSRNGRVVIESGGYELDIDVSTEWEMTEEEEARQQLANAEALTGFMDRLATAAVGGDDGDAAQSVGEAQADAEADRMNLLIDRVTARLDREGCDGESYERIYREERERLRHERGEPKESKLTPEEEAERSAWIAEANAAAEEAVAEMEAEKWKDGGGRRERRPLLVKRCSDLSARTHKDMKEGGWIPDAAQEEHPLIAIMSSVMSASAKLAGALGLDEDEEAWPPEALYAGDTLVRLKKARDYLRDAVRGMDSADEEELAPHRWRTEIRREIAEILGEVQRLIAEVRKVLADAEGEEGGS